MERIFPTASYAIAHVRVQDHPLVVQVSQNALLAPEQSIWIHFRHEKSIFTTRRLARSSHPGVWWSHEWMAYDSTSTRQHVFILTKRVQFSMPYFQTVIAGARSEGFDAITLTEHFNTSNFFDIYNQLDRAYEYQYEYYDVDGFRVFAGMEIDVQEGGHFLFTGHRDSVRALRLALENHAESGSFIPAARLFELAADAEFLKIGAHPFRPSNPLYQIPDDVLRAFDAFDLNGKDLFTAGIEDTKTSVYELAERIGRPVVCGSDSHYPLQLGCVANDLDRDSKWLTLCTLCERVIVVSSMIW